MSNQPATAEGSYRLKRPTSLSVSTQNAGAIDRYMRWFACQAPRLSETRDSLILGPTPLEPSWLENIQRYIDESVIPDTCRAENDGRWLNQEIAIAARDFFQKTAELLPGEPFIYSSKSGDLVAEFKDKHGTMTTIVSSTFVLLFAVIDGVPVERRIVEPGDWREDVQLLTGQLRTGQNGAVEASR
jgi:hypothetical protein